MFYFPLARCFLWGAGVLIKDLIDQTEVPLSFPF